jgi:hypothetical protein
VVSRFGESARRRATTATATKLLFKTDLRRVDDARDLLEDGGRDEEALADGLFAAVLAPVGVAELL